MSIQQKSSIELMNMYAEILAELNDRKVVRTYNSPVGDYAEWLVAEKLGFVLEHNSQKGYDAYDPTTGLCYHSMKKSGISIAPAQLTHGSGKWVNYVSKASQQNSYPKSAYDHRCTVLPHEAQAFSTDYGYGNL